VSHIRPG